MCAVPCVTQGNFVELVENNVRAAALAEYLHGTPNVHGSHCLLLIKVDEGVGMGIVLDGKLYRGPRMAAGEIGQMVIAERPGPERHDRPGCLEMLTSDIATGERYQRLLGGRPKGALGSVSDQVRRICHLAMSGDETAREAVTGTARYLGIGIFNAVWALDAEGVIIDGAITEAWPLVRTTIRDETNSKVKGQERFLYRAADSTGQTIDFLLTGKRDAAAAKRFFRRALTNTANQMPRVINVDKNRAYPVAVGDLKQDDTLRRRCKLRQCKYLNNIVEQDHRTVKRRPWLANGYRSVATAWRTLSRDHGDGDDQGGESEAGSKGRCGGAGEVRRQAVRHRGIELARSEPSLSLSCFRNRTLPESLSFDQECSADSAIA